MANVIQIKRGLKVNIAAAPLALGEFAFCYDTSELYIGDGMGGKSLLVSGGMSAGEADRLTTARNFSISGDGTAAAVPFDGTANVALALTLAASGVAAGEYTKVTVDAKGRVVAGENLAASDIPSLTLAKITDAGTAAAVNTGVASGNVPVLDAQGKLAQSVIPAIAITDIYVVNSEAAMLGLSGATIGDVAVRTDVEKSYILAQAPAATLANWQELISPTSPVLSVNGQIGTVTITDITGNAGTATALRNARTINGVNFDGTENITVRDDTKEPMIVGSSADAYWNGLKQFVSFAVSAMAVALSGLTFANASAIEDGDTVLEAFGKLQGQINNRAPLNSPDFTGTPTAPTASNASSSAQIATTAFVKNQGYLDAGSVIDGGTF